MNFQQLRTFRELTRRRFSLTELASLTHTTQPGLTRQIRDLESELGLAVFERHGKRITGLSEAGRTMLQIVERLLTEADRLLGVRGEYDAASSGTLKIATTHTQARYALPASIVGFREALPEVRIEMRHCSTEHVARLVSSGAADIGIAGEALASHPELTTFPCYSWHYHAVVPEGHPLLACAELTLRDLAAYPILTYDGALVERARIDAAFSAAGLVPDIVLTSMDSDIIKQYAALGFGVGLLAPMAFREHEDVGLRARDTGNLFSSNTTRLALRRGAYIRSYAYEFIQRFAPWLTRQEIDRVAALAALDGEPRTATARQARRRSCPPVPTVVRKQNMQARIQDSRP
jgi:LysR family cys regulon transcriptional activator